MARAGHSTARAALLYQHAAEERSGASAAGMDALSGGSIGTTTGTTVARTALEATRKSPEQEARKAL